MPTPRSPFPLAPLALLMALALSPAVSLAQAAAPAPAMSRKNFNVEPGSLETVLARFAAAAGIALSFDPALVASRQSSGINGLYSGEEGLRQLLQGSGLELQASGEGGYTLRRTPLSPTRPGYEGAVLPVVRVSAGEWLPELSDEGRAADGYRVRTVSALGALGRRDLLDTPFSISVVPQALLQNIQAQAPDDVYKLNATTRTTTPQASGWSPAVTIRGFSSYDSAEDGLRRPYNHAAVLEDKERVEVLGGLSGFLYGAASPGGMVNLVSKRPTLERLNSLTVGNYGGSQYYAHADFGGRIDAAGTAGYRINLVGQRGETAISDQHISRELASAAFEWQATDQLLLELNASHNRYETRGATAYWYYEAPHGAAPDARQLWSQPWTRDEFRNGQLMGRVTYQLNEHLTLRGAYKRDLIDRPVQVHAVNHVATQEGEFEQLRSRSGRTKDRFEAASALADIAFETGPVAHTLTLGFTMYSDKYWDTPYSSNTGWQGPYPLSAPAHVPEPQFPADTATPYDAGKDLNRNVVVGDSIRFNSQWSALLGLTRSRIVARSLDASGARTQPDYDRARNSPSLSILYKATPWATAYVSHIEGLERGGTAPATANNAGEVQAPMVSRQNEIGLKANVGGLMLAGAAFDIEKAYEYTDANNRYGQSGRQNHRGVEVSGTGKPWRHITLVGGATLLHTRVKGGDYDGKEPLNVAKLLVKMYAEYEMTAVPGLSLTGGLYHTGRQWANDANSDRLPAYTTADVGARYATQLACRQMTLRLNVNNVANRNYWMNSYYAGTPRSVALSAQMQF